MNIIEMTVAQVVTAAGTADGKFGLAVNQLIPSATSTSPSTTNGTFTVYESIVAGSSLTARGLAIAGNNTAVLEVKPSFFPVATKDSECAALVSSLDWADSNLSNYEYVQVAASLYFVTGILNSTQTQANDPFAPAQLGQGGSAVCWSGTYTEGLNPF